MEMERDSDKGEQSALDMRITKAGVDKIPLARLDRRSRDDWEDLSHGDAKDTKNTSESKGNTKNDSDSTFIEEDHV